jgi:hypothetical protein
MSQPVSWDNINLIVSIPSTYYQHLSVIHLRAIVLALLTQAAAAGPRSHPF